MQKRIHKQTGVTLPELLIAVAVGGILVALALPNFSTTIKNNRLTTNANLLIGNINLARSAAVRNHRQTFLCRSDDPLSTAPPPVCGGGTPRDWSKGWLIVVDMDQNGVYAAGTDRLIKRIVPKATGITFMGDANTDVMITYKPDGATDLQHVIALCDDRGAANGRQVNIAPTGRPSITTAPIANCTPP